MKARVFVYDRCATCRKALKFLADRGASVTEVPIVESPPSLADLKRLLARVRARGGDIKNLFNTSGERYRALGLGERFRRGLDERTALRLLSEDGKLIKRPVLLTARDGTVGFDPARWGELLDQSR